MTSPRKDATEARLAVVRANILRRADEDADREARAFAALGTQMAGWNDRHHVGVASTPAATREDTPPVRPVHGRAAAGVNGAATGNVPSPPGRASR